MIPVQDLKSNTVWSMFLFLYIISLCFPYCKCISQRMKSPEKEYTV